MPPGKIEILCPNICAFGPQFAALIAIVHQKVGGGLSQLEVGATSPPISRAQTRLSVVPRAVNCIDCMCYYVCSCRSAQLDI